MIHLTAQVRRALPQDRQRISNLLFYESNTHRHLDWRSALDWLGSQHYWMLEENGRIAAALACPPDPPGVGWIRLFAYQPPLSAAEAWSALWSIASAEIASGSSSIQVAAIIVKQWFQNILLSSGFEVMQNIILLHLDVPRAHRFPPTGGVRIRPMRKEDLPIVAQVDRAAFGRFWHNSATSLQLAYAQAVCATVAENDAGMVGYQITTRGNLHRAHLARLGVRPQAQGRGVGTALMDDLVQRLRQARIEDLSVNTQADNAASLALYRKMGFVRTGEYFPVLAYPGGGLLQDAPLPTV